MEKMSNPLVSVVITTKNEEKHIGNCINSIINQTYENIEIIVVDNDSIDKTKEIAKTYTKKVPPPEQFKTKDETIGTRIWLPAEDLKFEPVPDMTVKFDGVTYNIIEVESIYVGELIAIYGIQIGRDR